MCRCGVGSLVAVVVVSACSVIGCSDHGPYVPASWVRTYGGSASDEGRSVRPTTDGGFVIAGSTRSHGAGGADVYLVKTGEFGDTLWTKAYGGPGDDWGRSVQQTTDGGYVVFGEFAMGANRQYWLIKTDSNGKVLWDRFYGSTSQDYAAEVQQTSDGGYIMVGTTDHGGDNDDVWLVKTYADGTVQWSNDKGFDDSDERGVSVQQTADGGYLVAGTSFHVDSAKGNLWMVKTHANGGTHWHRDVGGSDAEYATSIRRAADGEYVILANLETSYVRVPLVLKVDDQGNQGWVGGYEDLAYITGYEVQQTADGGYVIAGCLQSTPVSSRDLLLVKLDSAGRPLWTKSFGGPGNEWCYSGGQTTDGGYYFCGATDSRGAGSTDVLLVKADEDGDVEWPQ